MKQYKIRFSYDTCEGRAFYATELLADNRQQAFDKAIEDFNSSIRLEDASEDGKRYYNNRDF